MCLLFSCCSSCQTYDTDCRCCVTCLLHMQHFAFPHQVTTPPLLHFRFVTSLSPLLLHFTTVATVVVGACCSCCRCSDILTAVEWRLTAATVACQLPAIEWNGAYHTRSTALLTLCSVCTLTRGRWEEVMCPLLSLLRVHRVGLVGRVFGSISISFERKWMLLLIISSRVPTHLRGLLFVFVWRIVFSFVGVHS